MRTKEFQIIFLNKIILFTGIAIGQTFGLYLLVVAFSFVKKYNQIAVFVIIILVCFLVGGMVSILALNFLLTKFDKLFLYKVITLAIAGFGCIMFPACVMGNPSSFIATVVFLIIMGILQFPLGYIDSFFLRDLIVYDTFLTGTKHSLNTTRRLDLTSCIYACLYVCVFIIFCRLVF